jgi:murein L,D-transpeptidase YafK
MQVKLGVLLAVLCGVALAAPGGISFREEQWKFPRVRTAAREKDKSLKQLFTQKGLAYPPHALLLRAFKKEGTLELWAENGTSGAYLLVKSYSVCATSGTLGPKRRFGDEQVPEGFYELDWFNPQSNFYLSLHVSYPNKSDRILGSRMNPGGDIFLHGNCVTIGCLPITDDGIKEVYWLAVLAKSSGQKHLPIQIFPARLTDRELDRLAREHRAEPQVVEFWTNLKAGFDYFEAHHRLANVRIDRGGKYAFNGE